MAPPARAASRPGSLTAQLNNMMNSNEDDIAQLMADLSSMEEEIVGFRYNADSTQESQQLCGDNSPVGQ